MTQKPSIDEQPQLRTDNDQGIPEAELFRLASSVNAYAAIIWEVENGQATLVHQIVAENGIIPRLGMSEADHEQLLASFDPKDEIKLVEDVSNEEECVLVICALSQAVLLELLLPAGNTDQRVALVNSWRNNIVKSQSVPRQPRDHSPTEVKRNRYDEFSVLAHQNIDFNDTSDRVANELRRVLDVDRVVVLKKSGRRWLAQAISGQIKVNRRSTSIRKLEQLAAVVLDSDRIFVYPGDDALTPQETKALRSYLDGSETRFISIRAISRETPNPDPRKAENPNNSKRQTTAGVIDNSMRIHELESRQMLSADIGSLTLLADTGESDNDLFTTNGAIVGTAVGIAAGDQVTIEVDTDGDQVADYSIAPTIDYMAGQGNFEFDIAQYEELSPVGEKDFSFRAVTTDFFNGTTESAWQGFSFHLSEFDTGLLTQSSTPDQFNLGGTGSGIGVDDTATGTGFILFSEESVHTRFSVDQANADHLVGVRFNSQLEVWEYSTNVDGEWIEFEAAETDRLIAVVDFDNDSIESLKGTLGKVNGIASGYSDGDLEFEANKWDQLQNVGEFKITGTSFEVDALTELGTESTEIGNVNSGVAVDDEATGFGFILFSHESIHDRFSANPPNANQADHLVAVRYNERESFWEYNADGPDWYQFDPREDDRLLAKVNYKFDTIDSLEGAIGEIFGIRQGFDGGDLSFEVNKWNGLEDEGEFNVEGTYFHDAPFGLELPETFELGAVGNGIAVDDSATGTGYVLFSEEVVHDRFSTNPPNGDNSDHLIAVRYNSTGEYWEYNADGQDWFEFETATSDRLLAKIDFDANAIESLKGAVGDIFDISQGFSGGDLTFEADLWGGQADAGEFTVNGTLFIINPIDKGTSPTLRFDSVSVGESSTRVIQFTNSGTYTVDVRNVSSPFGFDVIDFVPSILAPGETLDVTVEMTGLIGGELSGLLALEISTQGSSDVHSIDLQGLVYSPDLTLVVDGDATTQIDFGVLATGQTVEKLISVTNTGKTAITLADEIQLPDGFLLGTPLSQLTLNAGESTSFSVLFTGAEEGIYSGAVRIDLASQPLPVFTGSVLAEVDVPRISVSIDGGDFDHTGGRLDFGAVFAGTVVERPLTIRNDGVEPLEVSAIEIPAGMELVGFSGPFTLQTGEAISYTARLDSLVSMSAASEIIVHSNDPNESQLVIVTGGSVIDVQAPVLLNDVGVADGISSDPRVLVQIADDQLYLGDGEIIAHVDTDGDGTADESFFVGSNRFIYDPLLEESGSYGLSVQVEVVNSITGQSETTPWMSFAAEYDPDVFDSDPVLTGLALAGDNLAGNQMMSPIVTGSVSNDGSTSELVVMVDHNGDGEIDGYAAVSADGSFEYEAIGLELGPHTLTFTAVEVTYSGETLTSSEQSISFELVPYPTPDFVSIELKYPSSNSPTTSPISTIQGTLSEGDAAGRFLVVWDFDEEGEFLNATEVNDLGEFEFMPDVEGVGQYTIFLKSVDQDTGAISQVADTLTFQIEAMSPPLLVTLALLNDTSGGLQITEDPTISGSISSDWGIENREVQFDYNGDGEVDESTFTDENGEFEFLPTAIGFGAVTIAARTVINDPVTEDDVLGVWQEVNFVFERDLDVSVVSFSLANDDGTGVTTNPTVTGTAESSPGTPAPLVEVEFDYDGDGIAEASTLANGLGEFTHFADVTIGEQTTVRVRARELDSYNDEYRYGDWANVTFTRNAGIPSSSNGYSGDLASNSVIHSDGIADAIDGLMEDLKDQFNGGSTGGPAPGGVGGASSNDGFELGHVSLAIGTNNEAFGVTDVDSHSFDAGQESSTRHLVLATGGTQKSADSGTLNSQLTVGDLDVDADLTYTITQSAGVFTFDYLVTFALTATDGDVISGTVDGVFTSTSSLFDLNETITVLGIFDSPTIENDTDYQSTLVVDDGAWDATSVDYDFVRTEIVDNVAGLVDSAVTGDVALVHAGTYTESGAAFADTFGSSSFTKSIIRDYTSDYDFSGNNARSVNSDGVVAAVAGPGLDGYDSTMNETANYELVNGQWVFLGGTFSQTITSNNSLTETSTGTYTSAGSGTSPINTGSSEGNTGSENGVVATYTFTATRTITESATYSVNGTIAADKSISANYSLNGSAGLILDVTLNGTLSGSSGDITTTGSGTKTYYEDSSSIFSQSGTYTESTSEFTVNASGNETNSTISIVTIDGTKTVSSPTFSETTNKDLTLNHSNTTVNNFQYSSDANGVSNTGDYTIDITTTSIGSFWGNAIYTDHDTRSSVVSSGYMSAASVSGTSSASSDFNTQLILAETGDYTIDQTGSQVTGTFDKSHNETSSGESVSNLTYTKGAEGEAYHSESVVETDKDWASGSNSTDIGTFDLYFSNGVKVASVSSYEGGYEQGSAGQLSVISGDYTNDGNASGNSTVNISYSTSQSPATSSGGLVPLGSYSGESSGHLNTTTGYSSTSNGFGNYTTTDGVKEGTGTYSDTRNSTTTTDSASNSSMEGGKVAFISVGGGGGSSANATTRYATENVTTTSVFTEDGSHVDSAGTTTTTGNYSSTVNSNGTGTAGGTTSTDDGGSSTASSSIFSRGSQDDGTSVTAAPTDSYESAGGGPGNGNFGIVSTATEIGGNTTRSGTFSTNYQNTTNSISTRYNSRSGNGHTYSFRELTVGFSDDSVDETNGTYSYAADGSGTRSAEFDSTSGSSTTVVANEYTSYRTPGSASPYISVLGLPIGVLNHAEGSARSETTNVFSLTITGISRTEDGESTKTKDVNGVESLTASGDFHQTADTDNTTITWRSAWNRNSTGDSFNYSEYKSSLFSKSNSHQTDDGTSSPENEDLGLSRDDDGTTETSDRDLTKKVHSWGTVDSYNEQSSGSKQYYRENSDIQTSSRSTYSETSIVTEFQPTEGARSTIRALGTFTEDSNETRNSETNSKEKIPDDYVGPVSISISDEGQESSTGGKLPGTQEMVDKSNSTSSNFATGTFDNYSQEGAGPYLGHYRAGTFSSKDVSTNSSSSNSTFKSKLDDETTHSGTSNSSSNGRSVSKKFDGEFVQSSEIGESKRDFKFKDKTNSSGSGGSEGTLGGEGISGTTGSSYTSSSRHKDKGSVKDDGVTSVRSSKFKTRSKGSESSTFNKETELSLTDYAWDFVTGWDIPIGHTHKRVWSSNDNRSSDKIKGKRTNTNSTSLTGKHFVVAGFDPSFEISYTTTVEKDKSFSQRDETSGDSTFNAGNNQTVDDNNGIVTTITKDWRREAGTENFYYSTKSSKSSYSASGLGTGESIPDSDYNSYNLKGTNYSNEVDDSFTERERNVYVDIIYPESSGEGDPSGGGTSGGGGTIDPTSTTSEGTGEDVDDFHEHSHAVEKYSTGEELTFDNDFRASAAGEENLEQSWVKDTSETKKTYYLNEGTRTGEGDDVVAWETLHTSEDHDTEFEWKDFGDQNSQKSPYNIYEVDRDSWVLQADGDLIVTEDYHPDPVIDFDELEDALAPLKEWWNEWGAAILDGLQLGLDFLGMIPGVGWAFDLINAGIYVARGQYVMAGLSVAAAIPFAGNAVTAAKWATKAASTAAKSSKFVGAAGKVVSGASKVGSKTIGMATNGAKRAAGYVGNAVLGAAKRFDNFKCSFTNNCFVGDTEVLVYDEVPEFVKKSWLVFDLQEQDQRRASMYGVWIAMTATGIVLVLSRRASKLKKPVALNFSESSKSREPINTVSLNELNDLRKSARYFSPTNPAGSVRALGNSFVSIPLAIGTERSNSSSSHLPVCLHSNSSQIDKISSGPANGFRSAINNASLDTNAVLNAVSSEEHRFLELSDFGNEAILPSSFSRLKEFACSNAILAALCLICGLFAFFLFSPEAKTTSDDDGPKLTHASNLTDSRPNLNLDRLSSLGFKAPESIISIPIQDISVGMRVPAVNPQIANAERAEMEMKVDAATWRKFVLIVEKADGTGNLTVTLLRPSNWLVEKAQLTEVLLLELMAEEADAEDLGQPRWLKQIDEFLYVSSLDYWLDSIDHAITGCISCFQITQNPNPFQCVALFCGRVLEQSIAESLAHNALVAELTAEVQSGSGIGSVIWLDMPELGAVGFARIVENSACPEISIGPGQLITATFEHESAQVLDLSFSKTDEFSADSRLFPGNENLTSARSNDFTENAPNQSIGVTSAHPFWSVTRDEFIPAGELNLGEKVVTLEGRIWRLTNVNIRSERVPVYNFEVAGEHVYYVGRDGVLVHNLYIYDGLKAISGGSYKAALITARGLKGIPSHAIAAAKRLGGAIHGHHIVMKGAKKGWRGAYSKYSRDLLVKAFGKNGVNDVRNLAFAVNSRLGIHSTAYAKAVAKRLHQASKQKGDLAENLTKALDRMRKDLENGRKFW